MALSISSARSSPGSTSGIPGIGMTSTGASSGHRQVRGRPGPARSAATSSTMIVSVTADPTPRASTACRLPIDLIDDPPSRGSGSAPPRPRPTRPPRLRAAIGRPCREAGAPPTMGETPTIRPSGPRRPLGCPESTGSGRSRRRGSKDRSPRRRLRPGLQDTGRGEGSAAPAKRTALTSSRARRGPSTPGSGGRALAHPHPRPDPGGYRGVAHRNDPASDAPAAAGARAVASASVRRLGAGVRKRWVARSRSPRPNQAPSASERAQLFCGSEGLALPAPPSLPVRQAGQPVRHRVQIGRNVQAVHRDVVAGVHDGRDVLWRHGTEQARAGTCRPRPRPRGLPLSSGHRHPYSVPRGVPGGTGRQGTFATACSWPSVRHRPSLRRALARARTGKTLSLDEAEALLARKRPGAARPHGVATPFGTEATARRSPTRARCSSRSPCCAGTTATTARSPSRPPSWTRPS